MYAIRRRSLRCLSLFGAVLFCSTLSVSSGWADSGDDARLDVAQDAILEGRSLLKSGEYRAGIAAYERAYAAFPQDEHLFVMASALEKVDGACREALEAWKRYLARCTTCKDKEAAIKRRASQQDGCKTAGGPSDAVKALVAEARSMVQSGEVVKGIELYEKAYRQSNDALYLFAVASAYERLEGRCADALLGWGRYLEACPQCPDRPAAQQRQAKMAAACGEETGTQSEGSSVAPEAVGKSNVKGRGNSATLGLSLVGGGGATILLGALLVSSAEAADLKLREERDEMFVSNVRARQDEIESDRQLGHLTWLVGTAAALAGLWIVFGDDEDDATSKTVFMPAPDGIWAQHEIAF